MSRLSPRLIILPLVICTVAVGLSWWTSRQTAERTATIERTVAEWCDRAARGEDPAPYLTAVSFIARPLGAALVEACADAPGRVRVNAAAGPGPSDGAVHASHHAVVVVDGVPRVGINFLVESGRPSVVGYWKEQ